MTPSRPSQNEEEYFAREEISKLNKLADEIRSKQTEEEKKKLKDLHFMHCPKCGLDLKEILYKGVMIDKCFHCGAVTLDDGELEKLAGEEESLISSIVGLFK